MRDNWYVRLGRLEWQRFTYARDENDPIKLIGSIQRGAQIGALGMQGEQFVQVNGDFVARLNTFQVRKALNKAKAPESSPRPSRGLHLKRSAPAPAPEIRFKRRRVFVVTD